MKNNMWIFLIVTVITGLIGFTGINFEGVTVVRILFLVFADLLVISILSKYFFTSTENMKMIKVRK